MQRRRDSATWPIAPLRRLYKGESSSAQAFRYGLLAFDAATVLYLIVSSFLPSTPAMEGIDAVIGLVILADFAARAAISRSPLREIAHPAGLADLVAILSFLAPALGTGFGFLRVVRTLRLLRSYQLVRRLRRRFAFFRRNEDVALAIVHLAVFLFVMTALVYETQHLSNPAINNYADALYFTVTTLTTTGFGDITLRGTSGRLLAVLIMIFGVSLFIQLVRTLFRPARVHHECPVCGLTRHDRDAVHCKHCGTTLHIETEGVG